jgi:hypothetical protein
MAEGAVSNEEALLLRLLKRVSLDRLECLCIMPIAEARESRSFLPSSLLKHKITITVSSRRVEGAHMVSLVDDLSQSTRALNCVRTYDFPTGLFRRKWM